MHVPVLTGAAVLLFVFALNVHFFGDPLPIRNLRGIQLDVDTETALQARGKHGKMRVAKSGN